MADNKKTSSKRSATKKTAAQKSTVGTSQRKRQASRPPTIELKAEEVVDKATSDKSTQKKTQKPEAATDKKQSHAENKRDSANPVSQSSKTPLIAAALAGLIAGTAGGLVAGFILTGSQPDTDQNPQLVGIQERINNIEAGLKSPPASAKIISRIDKAESDTRFLNEQLKTLQTDITKLKDQITLFAGKIATSQGEEGAASQPAFDPSSLVSQITELQTQVKERTQQAGELTSKIDLLQKNIDAQKTALEEARQKTELSVEKSAQSSADAKKAYVALEKNVDDKINKLYQAGGDNRIRAAALSLSLRQFVESAKKATPFSQELDAVGALMPAEKLIDDLRPFAKTGVPDISMLRSGFTSIKVAPRQKEAEAPQGTLLDKIVSNAKSVVRVSRVGEEQTPDVNPHLLMQKNLRQNNLDGVLHASKNLKDQNKAVYQNWLEQVEKRQRLNRLVGQLQNLVLVEIGKSTNPPNTEKNKVPLTSSQTSVQKHKSSPDTPLSDKTKEVVQ